MPELFIRNEGPTIAETNYWQSDYATTGLCFLSINAGALRLLLPHSLRASLRDMIPAKTIVVTRGRLESIDDVVEIMFDDETDDPFSIWIPPQQIDRLWTSEDEGKATPFAVYVNGAIEAMASTCFLRRTETLPCLKPYRG